MKSRRKRIQWQSRWRDVQPVVVVGILRITALFGATCLSLSCHSLEPVKKFAVEGKVLVNGVPAQNVNVAFHPLNGDQSAFCPVGRTDRNGNFHLTTNNGSDGASIGEYNVTFVWPDPLMAIDECECPDPLIHDQFKGLYADANRSGYQAMVCVSNNSFRFNLWRPRSEHSLH